MERKAFTADEIKTAIDVLQETRHTSTQGAISKYAKLEHSSCVEYATIGIITHLKDLHNQLVNGSD